MKDEKTTIDRSAIAKRAYELYLARKGQNGNATEDWLRAETELRTMATRNSQASKSAPVKALTPPAKSTGRTKSGVQTRTH